jgi:hypothetical protein
MRVVADNPVSRLGARSVHSGQTTGRNWVARHTLRLDGEGYGPLWTLRFQQAVYQQMMYLVVVQSTVMALLGDRLGWHRMVRTGAASAYAARS